MNLLQLRDYLPKFYNTRLSTIIKSGPGIGKSDTMVQFAQDMSRKFGQFALVTAIVSGMDPVDIRGIGIPMKSSEGIAEVRFTMPSIWPNRVTARVFINGTEDPTYDGALPEHGLLFLDEFTQADTDIQKVCAQVILDKRLGEHKIPDGWVVWAAGNRTEDKSGVVKTLSHVQNRMMELNIEPDYQAWQDWAFRHNLHPLAISFAKSNAGEVFRAAVPKTPGPYCTPRSLVLCTNTLVSLRTQGMSELALPDDYEATETITGWLGEGIMPKFLSHIRLANDLPDIDEVVAHPDKAKVPDRLDARFVMATSLAIHAKDAKKLRPILKYITRLDKELQTLFVQSVVSRNPAALTVPEFGQWVRDNQKLILAAHG